MSNEFRRCLEECDTKSFRSISATVSPHLPQPDNDSEALITIHMARTQSESIAFRLRAYSHRWLTDQGLPSQLPDQLKPKAERIYPKIVQAVGISVNMSSPELQPAAKLIEHAMGQAVEDCFANGDTDPVLVSLRMAEAQKAERKALFGRLGL